MQTDIHPRRRSFFISTASAATALLAAGVSGCQDSSQNDRLLRFSSLGAAEEELARLTQAKELDSGTIWNWAQTLVHCAQSIEYSMAGYPESKSVIFQRTVGSAAFGVFSWRGRMSHDLVEPIPGAPSLQATAEPVQALDRLHRAILRFQQWPGPLQPHFAYGVLDKTQYELAHAMHLANHLSTFHAKS
jgi:Protein of unknown function (DUF1569)